METDEIPNSDNLHTSDGPGTATHTDTLAPALLAGFSKRKRKKVRNQLEFYFSSANLSKDKYLQQHMSPPMSKQQQSELGCGYVELDLIRKFGVMRELTGGSLEAVRRGVELSPELELSEDRTRVRRRQPITPISEEEVTLRTVYIEHIPPVLSSMGVLRKLFSKYGTVTYVSLPHYKEKNNARSKKVSKGFAFVEFSTPQAVARAVSAFQSDKTDSGDISEPKSPILNNGMQKFGKDLTNKSNKTVHDRKRRYDVDAGEEPSVCQNVKRNKVESAISQSSSLPANPQSGEGLKASGMIGEVEEGMTGMKKKKVKNKRTRRRRPREKKMLLSNEVESSRMPSPMKVMSKSEWLSLKSQFRSAQKECLGQLKRVNKQASMNASLIPREELMESEMKEVGEKRRGCDKILNQSMQVAESLFKH